MIGNKKAYEAAYQRALAGKSSRTFLTVLMAPFEDEYTRQSREKGEHDGMLAREQALAGGGAEQQVAVQ